MKKLIAVLLLVLMSVSCTAGEEIDIEANLETYAEVYEERIESDENVLPYTEPEKGMSDIFCEDFTISGDRYYFETRRDNTVMIAYCDLKTGSSGIICQDPLCSHIDETVCRYVGLKDIQVTEEEGVFYACRHTFVTTIYRVDVKNDTVRKVHAINSFDAELLGYDNGRLYFYQYEYGVEGRMAAMACRISYLDTEAEKVTELGYLPDELTMFLNYPLFVRNDEIYVKAYSTKLMKIDLPLTKITEVISDTGANNQWFWDDNTDELYFSAVDTETQTGAVYVYRNGAAEKLPLPHENIYSFTLTGDKIYYSAYDPIFYGISNVAFYFEEDPEDHKVYDYSGGKVYAVDRENPSGEAELVYNNGGEIRLCSAGVDTYCVFGDYLYFNEITVKREVLNGVEYTTFSHADDVSKIRIGLKDGSFTRISFE